MTTPWWSAFSNLRWRLVLVAILAMGITGWWLSSLVAGQLHRNYQEAMEESLIDMSVLLAAVIATEAQSQSYQPTLSITSFSKSITLAQNTHFTAQIYDLIKQDLASFVLVTDKDGIVLFDSSDPDNVGKNYSQWRDIHRTLQGTYGARATRAIKSDPSTAVLHVAAPIMVDKQLIGVVSVSKAVTSLAYFMHVAQYNILRALGAAILVSCLIALAATLWITRPLARLVTWAETVKAGGRPAIPKLGGGEVGRLAEAITGLQASLDGRAYVETYVQHLTHELKSPLAGIRGAAEILSEDPPADMRQRFLANIQSEGARLQEIVDRLLQLAELEGRDRTVQTADIPLQELIDDIIDEFMPHCTLAQLNIKTHIEKGLTIRGEHFLVRQAIANLLSNAIEFSPRNSSIIINASGENGMVSIHMRDHGPGIPEWAQARLFERFYSLPRPQSGRKGTGLGLAFVKEVADLHGGSITIHSHAEGGTEAVLRLPGIYIDAGQV